MIESARTTANGVVEVTIDGSVFAVPPDPGNRHWRDLQDWLAAGSSIEPYVPPPASPDPDPVEKLRAFLDANPDVRDLLAI